MAGRAGDGEIGGMPPPDTVYAYANSLQRTVATAQFFITGAFPGCDIPVHHQEKMGTMDPTFNPVITDDSAAFSEQAVAAMEKELSKLQLTDSYQLLEKIVNYKDSLPVKRNNSVRWWMAKIPLAPSINKTWCFRAAESRQLAGRCVYFADYEGFPMDQVAWEKSNLTSSGRCCRSLKTATRTACLPHRKWRAMLRNRWSVISTKLGHRSHQRTKITVLVGHDSNIASLLTALDFKPYQLHDQNERTPIGGKIVFQRWHDSKANRDLMKIEYVYQSAEQLSNADALTLQAPAQRVTLEVSGCPIRCQRLLNG